MQSERKAFKWKTPIVFVVGGLLMGTAVMFLWNAIMVPVVHAGVLNFWQALGMVVLSRILFGGTNGGTWYGERETAPKDYGSKMSDGQSL